MTYQLFAGDLAPLFAGNLAAPSESHIGDFDSLEKAKRAAELAASEAIESDLELEAYDWLQASDKDWQLGGLEEAPLYWMIRA